MKRTDWSLGTSVAALAVLLVGCDDQLKYVPTFSSMAEQPSLDAYEQVALLPPPGTVALASEPTYDLIASEALVSPLPPGEADLELGGEQFGIFCDTCHGTDGRGKGPVVGPNRIPDIPTLNLTSDQAKSYTDGYIWGMITNGRGLMPSYRRIPAEIRWQVVAYVRAIQTGEVEPAAAAPTEGAGSE